MEREKTLVENLIARLEPSPHGPGYVWKGVVTEHEVAALCKLVGLPVQATVFPSPAIVALPVLNERSLSAKVNSDISLCLDFGTAFSKAAGMTAEDELIEIGLGKEAAEPNLQFPVNSTVYLSGERIWFGPQAINPTAS